LAVAGKLPDDIAGNAHAAGMYRKINVASRNKAVLWGVNHGFTPDHHRIDHWRDGP